MLDEPSGQIADLAGALAISPIKRDGAETADMAQPWVENPAFNLENDAPQKNPVEIALEDGRRSVVPDRKHENQRFGRKQALDMALDPGAIFRRLQIAPVRNQWQNRIEVLRVEIASLHIMALRCERRANLAEKRGAKAFGGGVSVDDERAQDFIGGSGWNGGAQMRPIFSRFRSGIA